MPSMSRRHQDLPGLYVGVVALVVRIYNRLPTESKIDFEEDGDPMERLSNDFNQVALTLRMERKLRHDWAIVEVKA